MRSNVSPVGDKDNNLRGKPRRHDVDPGPGYSWLAPPDQGGQMMRTVCIALVLAGFVGLAVVDILHGDLRTGAASALLAMASVLLLAVT